MQKIHIHKTRFGLITFIVCSISLSCQDEKKSNYTADVTIFEKKKPAPKSNIKIHADDSEVIDNRGPGRRAMFVLDYIKQNEARLENGEDIGVLTLNANSLYDDLYLQDPAEDEAGLLLDNILSEYEKEILSKHSDYRDVLLKIKKMKRDHPNYKAKFVKEIIKDIESRRPLKKTSIQASH